MGLLRQEDRCGTCQFDLGVGARRPGRHAAVNGWLTIFWIAMIPVSIETGWVKSITYVSALSIWALVEPAS